MKFDYLEKGTTVLIKNDGINKKLDSRFKGPYKIKSINSKNNYLLIDSTGTAVDDEFPLSKLKVVEQTDDPRSNFEKQKILNHKD